MLSPRSLVLVACLAFLATLQTRSASAQVWTQFSVNGPKPLPRLFAASSNGSPIPPPYDPSMRDGIVIFGGTNQTDLQGGFYGDVWILNIQDSHNDYRVWTLIETEEGPAPEPRCLSAIAVDPGTMTMYMYGGYNGTDWFQDFWSLDLSVVQYPGTRSKWVFIGAEMGPPAMCGMSMVFCPIHTTQSPSLLMFGGGDQKRELYNTLWSYEMDNDAWTEYDALGTPPSPREFFGAYCFQSGQMVIFGGYDYNYDYYNDTHVLTTGIQSEWRTVPNDFPPNNRAAFAGTALNDNRTVVIFGGKGDNTLYDDVYTYEDDDWYSWSANTGPGERYGSAYGLSNRSPALVVFGGTDDYQIFDDLWEFIPPSKTTTSGQASTGVATTQGQTGGQTTGGVTGQTSNPTTGGGPATAGCGTCQTGYSTGGQQTTEGAGAGAGGYSTGGGQTGGESTGQLRRNKNGQQRV